MPRVVDDGVEGDVQWLITSALPGADGTASRWTTGPERIVRGLARGLRTFHEAPVVDCPFDFRLHAAVDHVRKRLRRGRIDPDRDFHEIHEHLTAAQAVARLEETRPPDEDPVVCHGDYCVPNVLFIDWEPVGFVDLGELGVADRWWDLAVASWSVTWNFGPGFEEAFLSEYGVERDEERTAWFRLLYDLVS